ncbi:MAG: adenylyl-sulfate kinase [Actinobacteria bacterium]|nr:adenylyl-sulfate kinase [Actinomycetota bacterium]MCB9411618.1 adenylyl-sulfate kinase [Actinomycetota bacterium]
MVVTEPDKSLIRVVTCGSVDDGKSTLLGRMLAETDSLPVDIVEAARFTRRTGSAVPVGEIDYSLVTDGLEAERDQGITIDVAYRHLYLPSGRRAVLADAPGHEQYTRNMAVAASTADVAILLADAMRGTRTQTHRHLAVCALMGVRHIVLAVNKMDGVDWDRTIYDTITAEVRESAARHDVHDVISVPVSALTGVNVTSRATEIDWYDGPCMLEALDDLAVTSPVAQPFRMPVQIVLRSADFRGYGGLVAAGTVAVGSKVKVADSAQTAVVTRLLALHGEDSIELDAVPAGMSAAIELDRDLDITRGDLLASADDAPVPADRFSAELVWLGEEPLAHGRSYTLRSGPIDVPATVTAVRHRLDVTSGAELAARTLGMNDVGRVEFATGRAVPLEPYRDCHDTGGFLLCDRVTGDTVAAGLTRFSLRRSANVVQHDFTIDRAARQALNGHDGKVLWFTGLSGSGKSTVANEVARTLHGLGIRSYVLDGDSVRHGLSKDLGFTPEDRAENVRRVAEVARLMLDAGIVVLVSLVSPFRSDRRAARSLFEEDDFVEIFVDTPLEVCIQRDPKGLYAKAADGSLPNMSGVGQDYEPPTHADLVLDGQRSPSENAGDVLTAVGLA